MRRGTRNMIVPLAVCAVAGIIYVWPDRAPRPPERVSSEPGGAVADPVAEQYVSALQQGRYQEVVDLTCWMQERLLHVQFQTQSPQQKDTERAELIDRLQDRSVERNFLRMEGVEDQYLFAPGLRIRCVSVDRGRSDLERPARSRSWFRVEYPARHLAIRNEHGTPIKALDVGVNVSQEGYVLKANVVGNLDVDWSSLCYDWD